MKDIEILANAPEWATLTCTICEDKQRLYIDNLDMLASGGATFWAIDGKEFDPESRYTTFNDDLQSLSDIQTIVDLRRENAELEKERNALDAKLKEYADTYFNCKCRPSEMEVHNLEQHLHAIDCFADQCLTGEALELSINYCENLRSQARALKESK
jgi:hypothetical protein